MASPEIAPEIAPEITPEITPEIARRLIASPDAMADLGACLAPMLRGRDCIGLEGGLGAGKSTLARGIITAALAACGIEAGDIPSPSFTLVQPYAFPGEDDSGREIWHFDLWRLDDPQEVIELGLEEALSHHISLIEWPQKMASLLPPRHLIINISPPKDEIEAENQRLVVFRGDEAWRKRLGEIGIEP